MVWENTTNFVDIDGKITSEPPPDGSLNNYFWINLTEQFTGDAAGISRDVSEYVSTEAVETFQIAGRETGGRMDAFAFVNVGEAPSASQLDTAVTGIATQDGDFDGDLDVDGADFLKWQRDLGDTANLALWETNFGTTTAAAAVASVPEPTSVLLLGLGSLLIGGVSRRRS